MLRQDRESRGNQLPGHGGSSFRRFSIGYPPPGESGNLSRPLRPCTSIGVNGNACECNATIYGFVARFDSGGNLILMVKVVPTFMDDFLHRGLRTPLITHLSDRYRLFPKYLFFDAGLMFLPSPLISSESFCTPIRKNPLGWTWRHWKSGGGKYSLQNLAIEIFKLPCHDQTGLAFHKSDPSMCRGYNN